MDAVAREEFGRLLGTLYAVLAKFEDVLPEGKHNTLKQFLDVGEAGLFVDELCAVLANLGIPVSRADYDELAALGARVEGAVVQPSGFLRRIIVQELDIEP